MSDAEQIGFDIDFDEKTQAWLDWLDPGRMNAAVHTFLIETLEPPVRAENWWEPMVFDQLGEPISAVFPDRETLTAPENHDIADQLVRFLGEAFIRRTGMIWVNNPEWGELLYEHFGPCVQFAGDQPSIVSMTHMAELAATGEFGAVLSILDDCLRRDRR
ncbi:hypothetical protein BJY24_001459 [Nocardia transvalensis]|uniref:Uncharacterized protein n=1 Tax=Nocardia transvalensis TaxID=37333 RepID=A0A7W9PAN9_9NOCA|nr:hypothetical protein [Nocardia transvalensis]MBB5912592.1 hypothetical protein [Nocardia transvalensis]